MKTLFSILSRLLPIIYYIGVIVLYIWGIIKLHSIFATEVEFFANHAILNWLASFVVDDIGVGIVFGVTAPLIALLSRVLEDLGTE